MLDLEDKIIYDQSANFDFFPDFREGVILLVDKPLDWTSFDVVNKIRFKLKHTYGIKKIKVGHSGTLDPLATGLLLLCTGKYTKLLQFMQGMDKIYTGTMKVGATTPSYDAESDENEKFPIDHIDDEKIHNAVNHFKGVQSQIPPIFSAVKIKGAAAYTLARRGEKVELKPREIEVFDFDVDKIDDGNYSFEVHCSKGTYIRSLAHDFGKFIGSGAYLTGLRREQIGDFKVSDAFSVEEICARIEKVND